MADPDAQINCGPVVLIVTKFNVSLDLIRFSQDTIKPYFEETHLPLEDAVKEILEGKLLPEQFPTMCVREYGDLYFTHNNRCLWVFKKAGISAILVHLLTPDPAPRTKKYMTFERSKLFSLFSDPEYFPRIRGYCRGDCHLLKDKSTVSEADGAHSSTNQRSTTLPPTVMAMSTASSPASATLEHSRRRSCKRVMRSSQRKFGSSNQGDMTHLGLSSSSHTVVTAPSPAKNMDSGNSLKAVDDTSSSNHSSLKRYRLGPRTQFVNKKESTI